MKLESKLDSLEGVDESLHENYEQGEDGKYHLIHLKGYVPADQVEDVSGLKSALAKERDNARNAKQEVTEIKKQYGDIPPDEVQKIIEERQEAEEEKAKKEGQWDQLKDQMRQRHQEELDAAKKETSRLRDALEKHLIDSQAHEAIAKHKGISRLLLPHVKGHVQVVEEDGNLVARVVDEKGNPRVNSQGDFLTIDELVAEMRETEDFAPAFLGSGNSGGGTPPGGGEGGGKGKGGGKPPTDLKRSQMSPKDKVAFMKEHGEEALLALPD